MDDPTEEDHPLPRLKELETAPLVHSFAEPFNPPGLTNFLVSVQVVSMEPELKNFWKVEGSKGTQVLRGG